MQLVKFIVACMPLAILASPIEQHEAGLVDRKANPDGLVEVAGFTEKRDDPNKLFRRNINCSIINASNTVNCRSCASTDCSVVTTFKAGSTHSFKCAVKGECVTVNGVTNCSWDKADRTLATDCWVNGYYTSSGCTLAALGTNC
ncbi:hypothetical protein N8I77_010734 [Diaporthe amygdali]|uniref:Effector protein n=1 Tax=Phomopsis amygdali TaxID=1214568 RepID=A0AAD9VZF8_PHOAM|nr:uncharacterized protein J7T55_012245 [Diaporthe amygdali]KAJ0123776.1 mannose binding [Diaporthe amygdali]KAK2601271.1 hypothetical protein N8I77_010734 [Diaporthe amygdali]